MTTAVGKETPYLGFGSLFGDTYELCSPPTTLLVVDILLSMGSRFNLLYPFPPNTNTLFGRTILDNKAGAMFRLEDDTTLPDW